MERKRRIHSQILTLTAVIFLAQGCLHEWPSEEAEARICFSCGDIQSKAVMPDENKISEISLMIFDDNGTAEECIWIGNGHLEYTTRMIVGKKYTLCACANFGYHVTAGSIDELEGVKCHLAYPDDYRHGIPMVAYKEFVMTEDGQDVNVEFERMMAKISLRIDRRRLSDDVDMYVRSVQIGNCPRTGTAFRPNSPARFDECFPAGFFLTGAQADALNENAGAGVSEEVSLYMLENMQGASGDEEDKICSYIEIVLDYTSDKYYSGADGLIYRFYLGEGGDDRNVERNSHYHIIVTPEDDGLSEDGWKVDKSDLVYCGPTHIIGYPSDYINGDIGDRIHIWCDLLPEDAPFDVGESYMRDDRANGIYDYVIDEDGHGATLTLTGPGTGLIYMEAGDPINDAALFIIEVNKP